MIRWRSEVLVEDADVAIIQRGKLRCTYTLLVSGARGNAAIVMKASAYVCAACKEVYGQFLDLVFGET